MCFMAGYMYSRAGPCFRNHVGSGIRWMKIGNPTALNDRPENAKSTTPKLLPTLIDLEGGVTVDDTNPALSTIRNIP